MFYNESQYNIVIKRNALYLWLYNSYSGAFVKIEKHIYDSFHKKSVDSNSPCQYFDELVEQGFLKPQGYDEFYKLITEERQSIYDSSKKALSFVIAPTMACNLKCVYCFEAALENKPTMTEETIVDAVHFIEKQITEETKSIHITWFGGEPLLAYNKIVKFYQEFVPIVLNKGISYTSNMLTNGVLLDKEKSKYLANECNLKHLQITLDGTEEIYCTQKKATKEQHQQVLRNIKDALAYFKVNIRFNGNKENFEDIKLAAKELVDICGKNKNLNCYFARIMDYETGKINNYLYSQCEFDEKRYEFKKYINELLDNELRWHVPKYRKTFCGLFRLKNLVIGPLGELYKCEHFVGEAEKVIGNIYQGLYYTKELYDFLNNSTLRKCKKCQLFPLCMGGCPVQKKVFKNKELCFVSLNYLKKLLKENYIN